MDSIKIDKIIRISKPADHAAFTDLHKNPFDPSDNTLFCCYRQARNHVSPDGVIIIVKLSKVNFQVITRERLILPDFDLRDPKFSFDGSRLLVTAFAKTNIADGNRQTKMVSFVSTTGYSWSSSNSFGKTGWWLWNHAWKKGEAFGFAYNRAAQYISLYKGDPSRSMDVYRENVFGLTKSQKGYPNESAFLFDSNENALVFLRRDADSFSAQFGTSSTPYVKWQWHDLGIYIGGPAAVALDDDNILVAGRHIDWHKREFTTRLWHFNTKTKSLTEMLVLPSSGDTSYPGLVLEGDTLYMSYYSCHVDNQARVYLAKLTGVSMCKTHTKTT
ncbi:hypothetical protein KUL42_07520 [Alteromonas sp. KUL42]|uniref:hypothetical protein n=1 Tax=Alteromonas sp. KUL42 TaxID=2480797 RepID=UPI001036A84F|nr:hypothetical protein [Alteromonas sp. KUL42]TAP37564.1 hypothetical protein EYR97_03720 [Alteromonas sp. KUL42]GEA05991.1 hypothetical protein KUL42_07520 [Alteromonas sp. KUL42]